MTAVSSLKNDLFRTNMKSCVTSLSFLQDLILLDCHCQLYEQFRALRFQFEICTLSTYTSLDNLNYFLGVHRLPSLLHFEIDC